MLTAGLCDTLPFYIITSGTRVAAAISLASSSEGSPAVGATLAAKPGRSSCMLGDDATAVARPRRCDTREHCAVVAAAAAAAADAAADPRATAGELLELRGRPADGLCVEMARHGRGMSAEREAFKIQQYHEQRALVGGSWLACWHRHTKKV